MSPNATLAQQYLLRVGQYADILEMIGPGSLRQRQQAYIGYEEDQVREGLSEKPWDGLLGRTLLGGRGSYALWRRKCAEKKEIALDEKNWFRLARGKTLSKRWKLKSLSGGKNFVIVMEIGAETWRYICGERKED